MKHFFTLILFVAIVYTTNATIRTITCQNSPSHFLPVTVNAVVGDTIHWNWVTGTHVVGPINATYIPSGAAMFNSPIDASNHSLDYVVTVAGNYHYVCHPASPHGEDGYIVVTGSAGVAQYNAQDNLFSASPNPSNGKFQFEIDNSQITKNCKIEICNLEGQLIYQSVLINAKSEIDLSNQTKGTYFMKFYNGQTILTKKVVIE